LQLFPAQIAVAAEPLAYDAYDAVGDKVAGIKHLLRRGVDGQLAADLQSLFL